MNIGIDARMYGLEHAGIGRYVVNLIDHLVTQKDHTGYTLLLRKKYYHSLKFPENVTKILADYRHYTLREQFALPQTLNQLPLDLVHFPHFNVPVTYQRPFVVTIHDLLWHQVKGFSVTTLSGPQYAIKYLGYRLTVRQALTQSKAIIVPSDWVKQQVLSYINIPGEKVNTIYEGISSAFHPKTSATNKILNKFNLKQPFIVITGSAYPHKNHRRLIRAIKLVNRKLDKPIILAIVSSRSIFLDSLKRFVKKLKVGTQVKFLHFIEDKDLNLLYHHALALAHPSASEGFGLTGLEAMASGLPVIASNAGSLPEIYNDAALYIDPLDQDDIASKIIKLVQSKKLQQRLISQGNKRVTQFSWQEMAQQTLKLYKEVLKK